jgi:hypothetical protein
MKSKRLALVGIASAFLWASTANSATITIGIGMDAGAPVAQVPTASGPGFATFSSATNFGAFTANQITATGRPVTPLPDILASTSLNIASGPGTLRVFVTSQHNTDVGSLWISAFTSNSLPAGWQVIEQTFIDPADGLFTTPGNPLGAAVFSTIGTSVAAAIAASGSMYSVTHLYTIIATSAGAALSTINLQTPLPGTLPLFATGLLGLWALRRQRKAAAARSLDPVIV